MLQESQARAWECMGVMGSLRPGATDIMACACRDLVHIRMLRKTCHCLKLPAYKLKDTLNILESVETNLLR